ncbi:chromosomal replication initiator protein DnaA [Candidatus Phytoplasma oryzae]|uniref:Chromosomal replication initiator protein DnaA n=1 Tax=Candidatus Phytoplasma oryzae TaxID=203274 RepID=A0A139JR18_9MOLU|nr:chromosomal replication initiator protein DnaA [Candidatus Phytoplasma oryzae]KXT29415.1 chromosomal replication initiator protein DnaA [Candidatus Phytoplasma oryzae]RAM57998.1 chromosomal replication initiator protein DnaA [Candidatus Phytoplasma oryzae]
MKKKELSKEEEKIWFNILNNLSIIYSQEVFKENFSNIGKPYKVEKGIFFILVENDFIKRKMYNIYLKKIEEISRKYTNKRISFKFTTYEELKDLEKKCNIQHEKEKYEKILDFNSFNNFNLDPYYSFDNFVEGESNLFAFKMAKKIAELEEDVKINPLYIFGSVGLGKTHLLHSIGNYIFKKKPHKKILYVKADIFVEEFTNQLRSEKIEYFKNKYRNIDILLVDDIQMMSEAKRTQVEFFKLFDFLKLNKKQIVITSDKSVSELNNIMERLTNRFEAGLIVDIKKPDSKHCLDILKKKILSLKNQENKFKKEILEFISYHFCDNIREMEGALLRILNYSQIYNLEINLKNTIESLNPILKNKNIISKDKFVLDKIKKTISEFYNISSDDLKNKKRHNKYTLPRHIFIYLMKSCHNISFRKISFFLNRKYSTILKAFKKIEREIKNNDDLKKSIDIILKKINNY